VNSDWLLGKINNENKQLISKQDIVAKIHESEAQIILTIGAGDIGEEVKTIKKELSIAI
jgi:UDP-N-acetylmuramate--alanine ligase